METVIHINMRVISLHLVRIATLETSFRQLLLDRVESLRSGNNITIRFSPVFDTSGLDLRHVSVKALIDVLAGVRDIRSAETDRAADLM